MRAGTLRSRRSVSTRLALLVRIAAKVGESRVSRYGGLGERKYEYLEYVVGYIFKVIKP
jgi:hypothetical protein